MTKILVLYYSMYGHIKTLAEEVAKGAKEAGVEVDIYQVPETLPEEVLAKMHAPKKADHPVLTDVSKLAEYDGIAFGIPTRYGRAVAQVSALFDHTGQLWMKGALTGKFATIFSSTATQHGGQETTALTTVPYLAHHGIIFVPIGYGNPAIMGMDEIMGGSPYGASTLAGGDGSRQPTKVEKDVALYQGKYFSGIVKQFVAGKSA